MAESLDDGAGRVEALKRVLGGLRDAGGLPRARARMRELVVRCEATEIAAAEQDLIASGTPVAEITRMCDLHSQAVRGSLAPCAPAPVPDGHPVDTFRRENAALREEAAGLRTLLEAAVAGQEPPASEVRRRYGLLMDVDKHYQRKELLLFPFLEKQGISGPSTVMWAKHDEVRALLKRLGDQLETGSAADRLAAAEPAFAAVEEMIFKEEHILLPMALARLAESEWCAIAQQSPRIGYCIVDPAADWPLEGDASHADAALSGEGIVLPSGALSVGQLAALFSRLPVDLTFVDAEDRVRFFSEGENRVFHRAKAVLGRKVQNCHPPASVGMVNRILSDFRSGAQSVAEFWIEMRGRFVHIRYFALRDAAGAYLGTLEVTQDLTRERALQGERRLLQYGA